MLKRLSALILSCTLALAGGACAIATACVEFARFAYRASVEKLRTVFTGPVSLVQTADVIHEQRIVAAREFVRRITRRDRPVLQSTWRMCPSI